MSSMKYSIAYYSIYLNKDDSYMHCSARGIIPSRHVLREFEFILDYFASLTLQAVS